MRDIFGMHDDDAGYQIERYVQCISPVSAVMDSPLINPVGDMSENRFPDISAFFIRCQKLELEKKLFDYIGESESDYLLIDAAEFRRKLLLFENGGSFSENYVLKSMLDEYVRSGMIPDNFIVEDPMEMDRDTINRCLDEYCDRICDLYEQNKIILVEIRAGKPWNNVNTEMRRMEEETAAVFNRRIDYAFSHLKTRLPSAHIVEFPENVPLDYEHKWGRNLLHYVQEYYDYALSALKIIIEGGADMSEKLCLQELKDKCETQISAMYSIKG